MPRQFHHGQRNYNVQVISDADDAIEDLGVGNLSDPGADRIAFWDDSAGSLSWLEAGTGLTITDTTITASAAAALDDLTDVTITSAATGETLYYNGTNWVNDDTILVTPGTDVTIDDDLQVNGTTGTGVNITLNYDETGTPSLNAGIYVERGTSTNTGLVWDEPNDVWRIADSAGGVELYYDGSKVLETTANGVNLITGTGDPVNFLMYNTEGGVRLRADADLFAIQQTDATGTLEDTWIFFNNNGSVDLYYDGTLAAQTASNGWHVYASSGGTSATVRLIDGDSEGAILQKLNSGAAIYRNQEHGANIRLEAEDSVGSVQTLAEGNPDGAFDLYYDGSVAAGTSSTGWDIRPSTGVDNQVRQRFLNSLGGVRAYFGFLSGDALILRNDMHGDGIKLHGANASGTDRTMAVFDPDSGHNFYMDGSLYMYGTAAEALVLRDGDGTNNDIRFTFEDHSGTPMFFLRASSNSTNVEYRNWMNNYGHNFRGYVSGSLTDFAFFDGQGCTIGSPTGGQKGAGTLNVEGGVYDNNSGPLTDYVFDAEIDGAVDLARYDSLVPNIRKPVYGEDKKGGVEVVDYIEEVRAHEPARKFTERLDDLDPEAFAAKWRARRKLPAFDDGDEPQQLSVGDISQRLLETCEVQAVHIDKLLKRIKALETKVDRTTQERQPA